MSDKIIADALGLPPLDNIPKQNVSIVEPTQQIEAPPTPSTVVRDEVIDDIEKAKSNISELIDNGKMAFNDLKDLAFQSQNPRAYEVLSTMLNTLVSANKEYVNMAEKKKYAIEDSPVTQTTNVTNNNLVISTSELLRMMKGEST